MMMVHEVVVVLSNLGEPSVTVPAGVGPLACVSVGVAPQVSWSTETLLAHTAGVGLPLEVDPPVVVQVARGCEPFKADRTLVRSLPAVNPLVGVETGGGGECLAAVGAGEGPVAGVGPDVSGQQGGPVKLLTTEPARETLLASLLIYFQYEVVFTARILRLVS